MTTESVDMPRSVGRSVQDPRFVVCATTGALQIAPDYRDKAAKALQREVRHMKFRLKLRLLSLHFRQFTINLRCAALVGERYFLGLLDKFGFYRHSAHPPA
jgi:hypothetical protein